MVVARKFGATLEIRGLPDGRVQIVLAAGSVARIAMVLTNDERRDLRRLLKRSSLYGDTQR